MLTKKLRDPNMRPYPLYCTFQRVRSFRCKIRRRALCAPCTFENSHENTPESAIFSTGFALKKFFLDDFGVRPKSWKINRCQNRPKIIRTLRNRCQLLSFGPFYSLTLTYHLLFDFTALFKVPPILDLFGRFYRITHWFCWIWASLLRSERNSARYRMVSIGKSRSGTYHALPPNSTGEFRAVLHGKCQIACKHNIFQINIYSWT